MIYMRGTFNSGGMLLKGNFRETKLLINKHFLKNKRAKEENKNDFFVTHVENLHSSPFHSGGHQVATRSSSQST